MLCNQASCKPLKSQFVISGLQVQLLSLAPRKILRYTARMEACIVGFLLYHSADIARKVRQKCDKSTKQHPVRQCALPLPTPDVSVNTRKGVVVNDVPLLFYDASSFSTRSIRYPTPTWVWIRCGASGHRSSFLRRDAM